MRHLLSLLPKRLSLALLALVVATPLGGCSEDSPNSGQSSTDGGTGGGGGSSNGGSSNGGSPSGGSSSGGGGSSSGGNSNSGSSDAVATSAELHAFCGAQCARSARCDGAGDAGGCVAQCLVDLGALATALRGDIVRTLSICFPTVPCDQSDDGCTSVAVEATGLGVDAAIHEPDVQACIVKHDACKGTSGAFSDDDCGDLLMLISSKRAQVTKCFAPTATCDSMPVCLGPVFGPQ